jgi:ribosomal protein S18 acetylase RimI-like enzyme
VKVLSQSGDLNPRAPLVAANEDSERTTATLVTSFVADPFIRWLFPDSLQYLSYFPQLLHLFGGRAFENSSAYRTRDCQAVALWLPPGVSPDIDALGGMLQSGVRTSLQNEVFTVFERVSKSRPQFPHWHLPVIGVDPRRQGKGYGSALLARGLEVCDRDHMPAYLEAINPANVPLYKRFGFEVMTEIQHGGSPVITTMLRPAVSSEPKRQQAHE